jgi:hypothetical protein
MTKFPSPCETNRSDRGAARTSRPTLSVRSKRRYDGVKRSVAPLSSGYVRLSSAPSIVVTENPVVSAPIQRSCKELGVRRQTIQSAASARNKAIGNAVSPSIRRGERSFKPARSFMSKRYIASFLYYNSESNFETSRNKTGVTRRSYFSLRSPFRCTGVR